MNNWPDPSEITIIPGGLKGRERVGAFYDGISNRIFVAPSPFNDQIRRLEMSRSEHKRDIARNLLTAKALFVIAHEYVRAAGFCLVDEFESESVGEHKEIQLVSGYAIQSMGVDKRYHMRSLGILFRLLNDGVATRIKDQVVSEYLHQGGTPNLLPIAMVTHLVYENAPWEYILAADLVQDIVENMSSTLQLPEEVVWNAFMAGYFAGPTLLDPEYEEAIKEALGEEIFEKLSRTSTFDAAEDIQNLMAQVRAGLPPITRHIAEKWIRTMYPEIERYER